MLPVGLAGEEDPVETASCGVPVDWLAGRLRDGLTQSGVLDPDIHAGDLTELNGMTAAARNAVIDRIVEGAEFPMVVVGESVACVGGVDVTAVVAALG